MTPTDIRQALSGNHAALATASDSVAFNPPRYFSFSTTGDIAVVTAEGETLIIPDGALAVGIVHPLRVTKIKSTGTGASGFVTYW